ncbi:dihydroflavonol-4-reductase [Rhizodiscina lignyota]|uniref:Dihydroflavonol-4-reductase n=1 Tax=Rhizodiscina lignyota TaxID=1504668 RepID=A0A9P4IG28_9PEZI|nr:dihydroflavonol-4-reductase [Rhizodiscina lignyota]
MKVLLTGGSGLIAAHCLDYLLQHGHDVVVTVRSHEKGKKMLSSHPDHAKSRVSYVIVEDIAKEDAFKDAVKSDLPFEAVLHTASPFHFHPTDFKKDLIEPAIIGTTGILKAIKASAPTVKIVVITSSFAAMVNALNPPKIYDETCWNPVRFEQAQESANIAYRVGKTYAEKAAWEFVENERPNFQVATILPTLVLGPTVHYLNSLDSLNTSNERLRDMILGKMKDGLAPTGYFLWADVRDVALAHVKAMEIPAAAGKRFFCAAGYVDNTAIADAIKEGYPQLATKLPNNYESDLRRDIYGFDNSQTRNILGIEYRPLKQCIIDTVKSLQEVGA